VVGAWSPGLGADCPVSLLKYVKTALTSLKYPVRLGLCRMMVQLFAAGGQGRIRVVPGELRLSVINCIEKALSQPAVVSVKYTSNFSKFKE